MSNVGSVKAPIQGPVLFLIDINDLHLAIKYSEVHHFADNTNPAGNCMFKVNIFTSNISIANSE